MTTDDPVEYRTFSVDYYGGTAMDVLFDEIVELFESHGMKIEGASDGPMVEVHSADLPKGLTDDD